MIRLDQIKVLESKVNRAVEQIRLLREENKALKRTVEKSQARMGELEGLVSRFKTDQDEIEQGILRALKNLDKLEDEVSAKTPARKESSPEKPVAEPAEKPPPEKPTAEKPAAEKPVASAAPAQAPRGRTAPAAAPPEPPAEPVVETAEDEPDSGEQLDIF